MHGRATTTKRPEKQKDIAIRAALHRKTDAQPTSTRAHMEDMDTLLIFAREKMYTDKLLRQEAFVLRNMKRKEREPATKDAEDVHFHKHERVDSREEEDDEHDHSLESILDSGTDPSIEFLDFPEATEAKDLAYDALRIAPCCVGIMEAPVECAIRLLFNRRVDPSWVRIVAQVALSSFVLVVNHSDAFCRSPPVKDVGIEPALLLVWICEECVSKFVGTDPYNTWRLIHNDALRVLLRELSRTTEKERRDTDSYSPHTFSKESVVIFARSMQRTIEVDQKELKIEEASKQLLADAFKAQGLNKMLSLSTTPLRQIGKTLMGR